MNNIKVYNVNDDILIPVTQEWCDNAQKSLNMLAKQRSIIKAIYSLHVINNKDKLDAIENYLNSINIKW